MRETAVHKGLYAIQLDDHWAVPIQFGRKEKELTELTRKVRQEMKEVNDTLHLTLSPNPINHARGKYNQNWTLWASEGLLDEVILQAYREDAASTTAAVYNSGLNGLQDRLITTVVVYGGYKSSTTGTQPIKEQIVAVQNMGHNVAVFTWEYYKLRESYPETSQRVMKLLKDNEGRGIRGLYEMKLIRLSKLSLPGLR